MSRNQPGLFWPFIALGVLVVVGIVTGAWGYYEFMKNSPKVWGCNVSNYSCNQTILPDGSKGKMQCSDLVVKVKSVEKPTSTIFTECNLSQ